MRKYSPWSDLEPGKIIVHPDDRPFVEGFNRTATGSTRIRTDLVPEPALGQANAPLVFLLLNPGVGNDDGVWHKNKGYRSKLLAEIKSSHPTSHFHLRGPDDAPGTKWWRRACRNLIAETEQDLVCRAIQSIEFSPYHSSSFGHAHVRLPTQAHTFSLVRSAMNRDSEIVLMRGERYWLGAIPELGRYKRIHRLNNPRSSSISPRNLGSFKLVQERILDFARQGY